VKYGLGSARVDKAVSCPGRRACPALGWWMCADGEIDHWSGLTLQNYTAINCVLSAHPSCAPAFIDEDPLITHTSRGSHTGARVRRGI